MSNLLNEYFELEAKQYAILKELKLKLTNFDLKDYRHFYWMSDGVYFRYENTLEELEKSTAMFDIAEVYNISGYVIFRRTTCDWVLPDDCHVFDPSKRIPWKEKP